MHARVQRPCPPVSPRAGQNIRPNPESLASLPRSSPLYQQPKPIPPHWVQSHVLSRFRGPQMPAPSITSRTAINRANAQHSTGPRTDSGKQRSSLNALRHGLTAASAVLPSEDRAAYDAHRRSFFDEYRPATPTETQLTQELADTAWRLNRIPALEAELFSQNPDPQSLIPPLATLGLHYQRLSRQFQKTVDQLRDIQADRAECQRRDLKDAAALLELHKHKGIPWEAVDHGFVFLKCDVERFAQRLRLLNESRHIEHVLFHQPPATNNQPGPPDRDSNPRAECLG